MRMASVQVASGGLGAGRHNALPQHSDVLSNSVFVGSMWSGRTC